jgi:hypothetical protein
MTRKRCNYNLDCPMNLVQCLCLTVALAIHQLWFCKELTLAVAPPLFHWQKSQSGQFIGFSAAMETLPFCETISNLRRLSTVEGWNSAVSGANGTLDSAVENPRRTIRTPSLHHCASPPCFGHHRYCIREFKHAKLPLTTATLLRDNTTVDPRILLWIAIEAFHLPRAGRWFSTGGKEANRAHWVRERVALSDGGTYGGRSNHWPVHTIDA